MSSPCLFGGSKVTVLCTNRVILPVSLWPNNVTGELMGVKRREQLVGGDEEEKVIR